MKRKILAQDIFLGGTKVPKGTNVLATRPIRGRSLVKIRGVDYRVEVPAHLLAGPGLDLPEALTLIEYVAQETQLDRLLYQRRPAKAVVAPSSFTEDTRLVKEMGWDQLNFQTFVSLLADELEDRLANTHAFVKAMSQTERKPVRDMVKIIAQHATQ